MMDFLYMVLGFVLVGPLAWALYQSFNKKKKP